MAPDACFIFLALLSSHIFCNAVLVSVDTTITLEDTKATFPSSDRVVFTAYQGNLFLGTETGVGLLLLSHGDTDTRFTERSVSNTYGREGVLTANIAVGSAGGVYYQLLREGVVYQIDISKIVESDFTAATVVKAAVETSCTDITATATWDKVVCGSSGIADSALKYDLRTVLNMMDASGTPQLYYFTTDTLSGIVDQTAQCSKVAAQLKNYFYACGKNGLLRVNAYDTTYEYTLFSATETASTDYTEVDCNGGLCVALNSKTIELWDADESGNTFSTTAILSSYLVDAAVSDVRLESTATSVDTLLYITYISSGHIYFLYIADKHKMVLEKVLKCDSCEYHGALLLGDWMYTKRQEEATKEWKVSARKLLLSGSLTPWVDGVISVSGSDFVYENKSRLATDKDGNLAATIGSVVHGSILYVAAGVGMEQYSIPDYQTTFTSLGTASPRETTSITLLKKVEHAGVWYLLEVHGTRIVILKLTESGSTAFLTVQPSATANVMGVAVLDGALYATGADTKTFTPCRYPNVFTAVQSGCIAIVRPTVTYTGCGETDVSPATNLLYIPCTSGVVIWSASAETETFAKTTTYDAVRCHAALCYAWGGTTVDVWDATQSDLTYLTRMPAFPDTVVDTAVDTEDSNPGIFLVATTNAVYYFATSDRKEITSKALPDAASVYSMSLLGGQIFFLIYYTQADSYCRYQEVTVYPSSSVPTDAPETNPPKTQPPPTLTPTDAPPTPSPPIPPTETPPIPPTDPPMTAAPPTESPPTEAPLTMAPETEAPKKIPEKTVAPETAPPLTLAPTDAPPTDPPETPIPLTPTPPLSQLAGFSPVVPEVATLAALIDREVAAVQGALDADDLNTAKKLYSTGSNAYLGVQTLKDLAMGVIGESPTFTLYSEHWGSVEYADHYISDALEGTGRYTRAPSVARSAAARSGVRLHAIWMGVVREVETAGSLCNTTGQLHLDRAWGYYAGSLEGAVGAGLGIQIKALSEEIGWYYGVKGGPRKTASVTDDVLALFLSAQKLLQEKRCPEVAGVVKKIVSQLTVPLLQGVVHYAHKVAGSAGRGAEVLQDPQQSKAFAWSYTAAVLPLVRRCSRFASDSLQLYLAYDSTESLRDGVGQIVSTLETVYQCLGVKCSEVGGHFAGSGMDAYEGGIVPCTDPTLPPAVKAMQLRVEASAVASSKIHEEEEGLQFSVFVDGTHLGVPDGRVQVEMGWEGAASLQRGGQTCMGYPCVTLKTNTNPSKSPRGSAATSLRNSGFALATITTLTTTLSEVRIVLKDANFRAYSPLSEQLTVRLSKWAFLEEEREAICSISALCDCDTPMGGCTLQVTLKSQRPLETLGESVPETARAPAAATVLAASTLLPASANAGAGFVRLSVLTKIALCPNTEEDEIDPTLNPLGLRFGSKNREANGAVVGSEVLIGGLLVLCFFAVLVLYSCRRISDPDKVDHTFATLPSTLNAIPHAMAKARLGWIIVPVSFLYGGAVAAGFGAILYSEFLYQILGAVDVVLGVTVPVYCIFALRRITQNTTYVTEERKSFEAEVRGGGVEADGRSCVRRAVSLMGWGCGTEWIPCDGKEDWFDLHHLLFDGYSRRCRFFAVFEQMLTILLAAVSAWEPETRTDCRTQGYAAVSLLGILFLSLVGLRPYLAPYETLMDSLVAGVEAAMMVCVLVSLKVEDPAGHWSVEAVPTLQQAALILILSKFALDMTIFVIDEYQTWLESRRTLPFILHLFCGCWASDYIPIEHEDFSVQVDFDIVLKGGTDERGGVEEEGEEGGKHSKEGGGSTLSCGGSQIRMLELSDSGVDGGCTLHSPTAGWPQQKGETNILLTSP